MRLYGLLPLISILASCSGSDFSGGVGEKKGTSKAVHSETAAETPDTTAAPADPETPAKPAAVKGLNATIAGETAQLDVGKVINVTPVGVGEPTGIVWASSNEACVKVDENGTITPVAPGTSVVTGKLADGRQVSVTVTITGGSVSAPAWTDVPLVSDENFELDCTYRFHVTAANGEYAGFVGSNPWYYVRAASASQLVWQSHQGQISHISNDSKTVYRVNGVPYTNLTVTEIQKICNRPAWTDVSLADGAAFDPECQYRYKFSDSGGAYVNFFGSDPWAYLQATSPEQVVWQSHNGQISHISAGSKTVYRVNGAPFVPAITVTAMQKTCPAVKWTSVALPDAAPFDQKCRYRFQLQTSDPYGPYLGTNPWCQAQAVSAEDLVWQSHEGYISHIAAGSKAVYRVNGSAYAPVAIKTMQKICEP